MTGYKLLREGEACPFGYGMVEQRVDFLGVGVAPLPLNYIYRWINQWTKKSYLSPNKKQLQALKTIRELQATANENGYQRGYREGYANAWRAITKTYMVAQEEALLNKKPKNRTPKKGS